MRQCPSDEEGSECSGSEPGSDDSLLLYTNGSGGQPSPNTMAAVAAEAGCSGKPPRQKKQQQQQHAPITAQEWGNMAVLVLLYAMQGIPLGLTLGAM